MVNVQSELNDLTTERAAYQQQIKTLKGEAEVHLQINADMKTEKAKAQKDLQRSLHKLVKYKVRILL